MKKALQFTLLTIIGICAGTTIRAAAEPQGFAAIRARFEQGAAGAGTQKTEDLVLRELRARQDIPGLRERQAGVRQLSDAERLQQALEVSRLETEKKELIEFIGARTLLDEGQVAALKALSVEELRELAQSFN